MQNIEKTFDITQFFSYKDVAGQYTDTFIKSSRCVKLDETDSLVKIIVCESSKENCEILKSVHSPKEIELIVVKDSEFAEFTGSCVEKVSESISVKNPSASFSLEEINSDAPVVNIINAICLEAIRKNASDIHIQGTKNAIEVRLRIDGVLETVKLLDKSIFDPLVSRIKVMSDLNVMEKRLCQDGRMSVFANGRKLDFRVSIVPAVFGQNVVLRLFNAENNDIKLDALGFSDNDLLKIKKSLNEPHGMILVTGPTGSGKSTTLHAMLREMDINHLKIVTIEDPVEKIVDGIEQIQVNDEIGLTFSSILRRILRQDPDVIMVGEIRDKETAELAVRSALTGHLILSTLHTNDSISSVTRLKNLGIEPYLISGVLKTCIAQRLVRRICPSCKGCGCSLCSNTGYKGRIAVGEVFEVSEMISSLIENNSSDSEIRTFVGKSGFTDLKTDARRKVEAGITSEAELMREGLL